MATTLAALITSCRILSGDGPSDNFARSENLLNNDTPINGTNKVFYLQNNPVPTVTRLIVDNQLTTGYTLDTPTGTLTLTVAPTTSAFCSYQYYLFSDAVWTEFINTGLEALNLSSGVPDTDLATFPLGLLQALKSYVSAYFCFRIAKQTGLWYNQRLQERVEDRDSISKKWQALGDKQFDHAMKMRDDFYSGSGADRKPSFRIVQNTPLPWTPTR